MTEHDALADVAPATVVPDAMVPAAVVPAALVMDVGDSHAGCQACGSPSYRVWHLGGDPVRLCPPCATLDGVGCP